MLSSEPHGSCFLFDSLQAQVPLQETDRQTNLGLTNPPQLAVNLTTLIFAHSRISYTGLACNTWSTNNPNTHSQPLPLMSPSPIWYKKLGFEI